jgi:uncharacterized SAM-binding protein YcdF (DUF218 family)
MYTKEPRETFHEKLKVFVQPHPIYSHGHTLRQLSYLYNTIMVDKSDKELAQILWDYNYFKTPLQKADIILGLGNSDIKTAQHAAELYHQGYASLILFTGQYGPLTKDNFEKTEAEIFTDEAVKMGVARDKIMVEKKATNTGENIEFARDLLREKGLSPTKFIVVTKPHQLRRAYATFMKVWPGRKIIMSSIDTTMSEYIEINDLSLKNYINSLVAATQRVMLYPEKGFQIPQEIPREVWEAYEELVKRGYNKQLI